MENIYYFACIISIVYMCIKFIEFRFIEKNDKSLKLLIRDTIFVYFSVIIGDFVLNQVTPTIKNVNNTTVAFTDNPSF